MVLPMTTSEPIVVQLLLVYPSTEVESHDLTATDVDNFSVTDRSVSFTYKSTTGKSVQVIIPLNLLKRVELIEV